MAEIWEFRERYLDAHKEALGRIEKALNEEVLTNGEQVRCFEKEVAFTCGAEFCVAVSSATIGIQLALRALDIVGPVLIPGFGFSATYIAALGLGLRIVAAPTNRETFNLATDELSDHITNKSAGGVIGQAVAGNLTGVEAAKEIATGLSIPFVLDAASAIGELSEVKRVSRFADVAVVSFAPKKPLPIGEGGAVLTDDPELADRIRCLRTYGTRDGFLCEKIGINGRMSEIHAAIGRAFLPRSELVFQRRKEISLRLRQKMSKLVDVALQRVTNDVPMPIGEFVFRVPEDMRDEVLRKLRNAGVPAVPFYSPPVIDHPAVRKSGSVTFVGEIQELRRLSRESVGIPFSSLWDESKVQQIYAILNQADLVDVSEQVIQRHI